MCSLKRCILTRQEACIWWWPMLASCSAGWQVWVVLRRQHNQPLWRKESFTPLSCNLSCQLRRFVDEIQGELQPVCLGWENEGSSLRRRGCRQGEKERAVCKQLPFGRRRWTGGYFKIKTKVVLLKGQGKFFNPSSLAKLAGTWSRVRYSIFKGSFPHDVTETSLRIRTLFIHSWSQWDTFDIHIMNSLGQMQHQDWQIVKWMSSVGVDGWSRRKPQKT